MDGQLAIRTRIPTGNVPQKPRIPCRYYARGSCSRGDTCHFAHGASGGATSSSNTVTASDPASSKSKVPCLYFASGNCTRDSCPFAHDEPPKLSTPLPAAPVQPQTDSRSEIPCQFFARGNCRNGEVCPFAHAQMGAPEGVDEQEADGAEIIAEERHSQDNWTRELGGALAKFEDGAAVSKLSLPSDFSAIRLNNLPQDSSPESVAALLSGIDVVVSADYVQITTQAGAPNGSAEISTQNPLFAKTMCSKLRNSALTSHIEIIPVPVPMPQGSSLHRVDCRKVHCSWHRPTRTAWLNFGTLTIARRVQERFNAGLYKLSGCTVKANAPTGKADTSNPFAWTVMLTDLAGTVKERDIVQAVEKVDKPRRIVMGKLSYNVDAEATAATVKSMLLQIGPLEWWDASTNSIKGKRIKAQARFLEESHAREAASSLNNKTLSFSKTARLTAQLMTSTKFKVSTRIYDVLSEQLESHTPIWERQHIHFIAYPPHNGYRVLKLESENSQLVAQAKAILERIVSGEVARKDGKDLWRMSFGRNGDEYQRLKQVGKDHGVVIVRDRRKSQLRLFGPEAGRRRAAEALETLLQNDNSNGHVIELDPDEFQWACRGGFSALTAHLGNNKATFDIVSTPKRILLGGSKAEYTATLAFIAGRKMGPAPLATSSGVQTDCSVCWTEAEDPIHTSCNHTYCAGCFADLCQAEASASTEFRILCVGDQARCKKTLALSELQDLLPSAAFESLLEDSFTSYIRRHPADFGYCPTPDCGQIYRVTATTDAALFTCPKCLIPTCTACHSPHPGMTCAEHKDIASGGYEALERVKKELGIKDCPKCKTAMEKIEGCNHMTCRGCGVHICWVCLATFKSSAECYGHLSKTHGGVFDYQF